MRMKEPSAVAWTLLLAPACILLHELGHYVVALAVGYPNPVLRFSGVDPGPGSDVPLGAPSILFVLILWWVNRNMRQGERVRRWLGLVGGTTLGWAVWMQVVGPWWLP
jgi:hypothetical protein